MQNYYNQNFVSSCSNPSLAFMANGSQECIFAWWSARNYVHGTTSRISLSSKACLLLKKSIYSHSAILKARFYQIHMTDLSLFREHYTAAAVAPCCSSMWMTWLLVEIINYVATRYALLQNETSWAFSLFPRAYNLSYKWWHSTSWKEICRGSSCLLIWQTTKQLILLWSLMPKIIKMI